MIFFISFSLNLFFKEDKLQTIDNSVSNKEIFKVVMNNISSSNNVIIELRNEFDNDDIKGMILSEAIGLNTVIVQSKDNGYYMNNDIDKTSNIVGSIFLDYRNSFSSKKLLIYGHNSRDLKTDFGKLEKYLDLEFTKNNPYLYLITDNEKTKWEIFSVMIVPNDTTEHTKIEFSSATQLQEHLNWMKNNSKINLDKDVNVNDHLMTLQTCYYEPKDSFLLINLKKVDDNYEY